MDLAPIFNHYLNKTTIPKLELKTRKGKLEAKWSNADKDFNMPVDIILTDKTIRIYPKNDWTATKIKADNTNQVQVLSNKFYILTE